MGPYLKGNGSATGNGVAGFLVASENRGTAGPPPWRPRARSQTMTHIDVARILGRNPCRLYPVVGRARLSYLAGRSLMLIAGAIWPRGEVTMSESLLIQSTLGVRFSDNSITALPKSLDSSGDLFPRGPDEHRDTLLGVWASPTGRVRD